MSRKMIPVEESGAAWRKDPKHVKVYNALEDEFSLAKVMIEACAHAGLTREQLAESMPTTQAVIAMSKAAGWSRRRARWSGSPRQPACGCGCRSSRRRRGDPVSAPHGEQRWSRNSVGSFACSVNEPEYLIAPRLLIAGRDSATTESVQ
jgi:hypothetical protein